eukprot:3934404-Amphidinium_carterae.2
MTAKEKPIVATMSGMPHVRSKMVVSIEAMHSLHFTLEERYERCNGLQSCGYPAGINGGQVLPLTESRLENGGAAATTAQRFAEAAILLCVISNSNVLSARLKGAAFQQLATNRPRVQASQLTLRQLGKHSDPKDKSMHVYSRDVSMVALLHVSLLFQAITAGVFDTHATRSVVLAGVLAAKKKSAAPLPEPAGSPHTYGTCKDPVSSWL